MQGSNKGGKNGLVLLQDFTKSWYFITFIIQRYKSNFGNFVWFINGVIIFQYKNIKE
ncbi:AICAR transformylaseIMP cyclohydrolase PurH [Wolbachia endosymbiont of Onchocerca ochengi]|nr:AICAR transformylaseIMP cyclohydrolase PurH [Wolbachia endosymbiont of Onchocerca ochengi]